MDNGFIILPANYSESGPATRLVINCHGAGGTVTTDDSQVEQQALTQYLVANNFAVMDVNGLPFKYAEKYDTWYPVLHIASYNKCEAPQNEVIEDL